jgi:hypothetical protein
VTQSAATRSRWFLARGFSTLKMEAIRSSETSVHTRSTRRHIPEDGILLRIDLFPKQHSGFGRCMDTQSDFCEIELTFTEEGGSNGNECDL